MNSKLLAISLIFPCLLAACSQASITPGAVRGTLGPDPLPSNEPIITLSPDLTLTILPAATTPPPTATATLEPTLTPQFTGCDVLAVSQIEAIIGPLNESPQSNASVGEQVGYFDGCIYQSSAAFVGISFGPYRGISARAAYDNDLAAYTADGMTIETVDDLADAAFWFAQDDYTGTLEILRGDVVLITLVSADNSKDKAIQIARIALVRIP